MKNANLTRIDETVGVLYEFAPHEIEKLIVKYPNKKNILQRGIKLGIDNEKEELHFRSDVCIQGLQTIIKKSDELIPVLKERLKKLNYLQLINQIILAISSASLLVTLQEDGLFWVKYLAAILALIASILGIIFQYKSSSLLPNSDSIISKYNLIVDLNIDAQKKLQELLILFKISNKTEKQEAETRLLINKGNEISFNLIKCIAKL